MSNQVPRVSVWMISYNHEKYITTAIESVLMQKTNFAFDLLIGEDHSSDKTLSICQDYEKRFPEIIKVLNHQSNLGIHKNLVVTLQACKGEYIAMLEGDDYWTDEYKLQKQVDFLDAHNDFVMCYQKTIEINEVGGFQKVTNEGDHQVTGIEEILHRGWFIRTGSLVFRNGLINEFPKWYFEYKSTDYMLHILIAEHGKVGFLDEVTSVYRRHEGGVTQAFQRETILFNKKKVELLHVIDKYLNFAYSQVIRKQIEDLNFASFVFALRSMTRVSDVVILIKLLPLQNLKKLAAWSGNYFIRKLKLR